MRIALPASRNGVVINLPPPFPIAVTQAQARELAVAIDSNDAHASLSGGTIKLGAEVYSFLRSGWPSYAEANARSTPLTHSPFLPLSDPPCPSQPPHAIPQKKGASSTERRVCRCSARLCCRLLHSNPHSPPCNTTPLPQDPAGAVFTRPHGPLLWPPLSRRSPQQTATAPSATWPTTSSPCNTRWRALPSLNSSTN